MIKEAAIQRKSDGRTWTGRRHNHVIHQIIADGHIKTVTHAEFVQGFITDDGRFVDRCEAFRIACGCGQIKDNREDPLSAPPLISEDLY